VGWSLKSAAQSVVTRTSNPQCVDHWNPQLRVWSQGSATHSVLIIEICNSECGHKDQQLEGVLCVFLCPSQVWAPLHPSHIAFLPRNSASLPNCIALHSSHSTSAIGHPRMPPWQAPECSTPRGWIRQHIVLTLFSPGMHNKEQGIIHERQCLNAQCFSPFQALCWRGLLPWKAARAAINVKVMSVYKAWDNMTIAELSDVHFMQAGSHEFASTMQGCGWNLMQTCARGALSTSPGLHSFVPWLKSWMCCQLIASAEIFYCHSNFADAARRWEFKESGGAAEFWFSTVLGLEGPTSPCASKCVYVSKCAYGSMCVYAPLRKTVLNE